MSIFAGFHWPISVPHWPLLVRVSYFTESSTRVNRSKSESFKVPDTEIGKLLIVEGGRNARQINEKDDCANRSDCGIGGMWKF
jgi:hypothetical protein